MLQKTFEISTKEEAEKIARALREIPEAAAAAQALLQVYVFSYSYDETVDMINPVFEAFPGLVVTGMTMYSAYPPDTDGETAVFDDRPLLRLGFYFFESSAVRLLSFEIDDKDPDDVVGKVRKELAAASYLRGVCVTLAGFALHTSRMLEKLTAGFEDIPFFGTMADVNFISERHTEPFIFNNEREFTHGVIFLLFSGGDLRVEAQYIFGWTPIGKAMPIKLSDEELTVGDSVVSLIDGVPPEKVYKKYLGIHIDEFLTVNCCEFPLVVERNGLLIGRTPYSCNEKGEIVFIGSVRPGESVRFSYTVRSDLIKNTDARSLEMREFAPQAMMLFVCGNRGIMLRKESVAELDCFRRFAPELQYCSAAGEIYFHHGRGDLLNSALVAVGIREGEPHELTENSGLSCKVISARSGGVIPLSERVLTFMRSMSGDIVEYARDAQRANKAKSDFLANMSHDIRTPINAVLGMNEMILRESAEKDTLAYATDIRTAGNTLLGLINDILDFSKIESGKLDLIPVDYDLASVLNDLMNMIHTRADAKGLALIPEIDGNIPKLLHGDEIRIKQIITNILTNAVKYTEKGSVTFKMGHERLQDDADSIMLNVSISDTGIGIKQEDIPKLFVEFERIEESRNRSIEGTGLGMNITQRLLAMMNSKLEVTSEYGKGSTFSFSLKQKVVKWEPVGDYEEAFRRSLAGRKKYRERFTAPDADILVIDDTPMNLQVFRSLLKSTLVRIDTAESGDAGLELARKHKYDIIFIDHMMPHKDGIETLKELKGQPNINRDTPAVCLTANAISGAREKYLADGFDDYLTKPIEPERLEQMIMEYLPEEKLVQAAEPDNAGRLSPGMGNVQPEQPDGPAAAPLPEQLYGIDEINVQNGLQHCGSPEIYLETLKIYADTVGMNADEIERYLADGDLKNATVKIHALKSTSRVIGAMELGSLAEQLEKAGNENDADTVKKGAGELLSRYRALGEAISSLNSREDDSSLPLITDDELNDAYTLIRECLSVADFDSALRVIDGISEYSFPENEKDRFAKLKKAAAEVDYDAISEILA